MNIHDFQRIALNYIFYVFYILYFVVAFGVNDRAPQYLSWMSNAFLVYLSTFLMIRFNPWRVTKFTEFDKTIAYNAGIQLFISTIIVQSLITYLKGFERVKRIIKKRDDRINKNKVTPIV
jgi:hypothetical protein